MPGQLIANACPKWSPSRGSNSVAATNNAQIWRNATQRIESIADSFQFAVFRFIYHLSLEIEIAFRSGFFLRLLLRLPLPLRLLLLLCLCNCNFSLRFIVLCFLLLSLSLSRSLLSFCFAVIGAIAPGNHCQQLMKAIVGVAAF